jgi:hypothetical protein
MEDLVDQAVPADVRREKVVELAQVALQAIYDKVDKETSPNEIFSAGMSVAATILQDFLELGANPEQLRKSVLKLWETLPKESVQ